LPETGPSEPDAQSPGSSAAQVAVAGAWGLGGRAVLLLANLIATPFLIRLLGPSRYGLWALLQTAMTWAFYADLGMGTASTKFGAEAYAHRDDRGEAAIVWTALGVISVVTSSVAVVVAACAHVLVGLLGVHGKLLGPGVLALRLGCVVFVLQAVVGIVKAPPTVRLQWRGYTIITTVANLFATIGAPLALLLLSGGVVTVMSLTLGASALMLLGVSCLAYRLQPALRAPRFDRKVLSQLLGYGGALTVGGLANIPLTTAERFFLASTHSTTVVAYYAVAATIATTLLVVPEQLTGPLIPGLVRLEATGHYEELRALFKKALSGFFLVLTPGTILLALVARPLLSVWAGATYGRHSGGPLLVLILGVWFGCFGWLASSYLQSSGRTKVLAYVETAEVVPYLILAWVLSSKYGALGAALAWSSRFVVDMLVLCVVVRRSAGVALSPLPRRGLRSVLSLVSLGSAAALAAMLSHTLGPRTWWVVGLGVAYAATTWRLVLTAAERRGLTDLLRTMLGYPPAPRHSRRAVT
jgi:O-antigen/teichoic acid export membrane protein